VYGDVNGALAEGADTLGLVTRFTTTVTPPNKAPTANNDVYSVDEDTTLTVGAPGVTGNDTDANSGDTLTVARVADPSNGTLTLGVNGLFTYTPNENFNGSDSFTYKLNDGTADSNTATVTITVNPVNDKPGFTKGADQTVNEDALAQTVTGWATGISAGPSDESSQTVTFTVTNGNNSLFSVQPAIASDGTLTYTPAPNANGTATVTVTPKDNGNTASGGVDTGAAQTFTITVNPVNDKPDAVDDPNVSTPLGTSVKILVLANDMDVDKDVLNITTVTKPTRGTVKVSADKKSVTYDSQGIPPGTYTFTYTISDRLVGDPARLTDTATVTVKVTSTRPF
jgi:VCBS repeat-containing protein